MKDTATHCFTYLRMLVRDGWPRDRAMAYCALCSSHEPWEGKRFPYNLFLPTIQWVDGECDEEDS